MVPCFPEPSIHERCGVCPRFDSGVKGDRAISRPWDDLYVSTTFGVTRRCNHFVVNDMYTVAPSACLGHGYSHGAKAQDDNSYEAVINEATQMWMIVYGEVRAGSRRLRGWNTDAGNSLK